MPAELAARGRPTRARAALWALALAAVLVAGPAVEGALAVDPSPSPTPSADPTPTPPVVTYRVSLLRSGSYVRQYTSYQCVGASLQMLRNMSRTYNTRSPYFQKWLWRTAHRRSLYRADGGADPFGWTRATAVANLGRFVLVAAPTYDAAVRLAARGIALTGRPAGIVVWRGRHAWVITGVEATADPAKTDDFDVVAVKIADPLYRSTARRKGIIPPGSRLDLATFARQFTPYHDGRRDARIEGRYVIILPVAPGAALPEFAVTSLTGAAPISTPPPSASPSPTADPTADQAAVPTPEPTPEPTASPSESVAP